MRFRLESNGVLTRATRALMAGVLCVSLMVERPTALAAPLKKTREGKADQGETTKVLHALEPVYVSLGHGRAMLRLCRRWG